jgi:predicted RNA binding protein YcfA (HicA-like mRNA interferase family)
MSGRLPSLRGEAVIRALKRAGFNVVRIKGSHHILEHADDPARRTVVPVHAGHDVKRELLSKIIDDAGPTVEEFSGLL